MCLIFHAWKYIGAVEGYKWLAGAQGGIPVEVVINAKQCVRCGKIEEV